MLPNIVLILIDDMGWRDLSCCGSTFYKTPAIDSLAQQSVRFTQAYAACPVCSPSRAALLTGRSPARLGITNYIHTGEGARGKLLDAPFIRQLPHSQTTLAALLRQHGYATWHVGKWHLGEQEYWPETHGFDVNIAGCSMGHPHHGYYSPYHIPTLSNGPEGEYLTDRLTTEAVSLIEQHQRNSPHTPFFLNLWHYAVHTPIQAPAELAEKCRLRAGEMGLDAVPAFQEGDFFPVEHKRTQRILRRTIQSDPLYAAMVENLDCNIEKLLNCLQACGLMNNTLIVFTSDNGGLSTAEGSPTCNLPLAEGKGWAYEGGLRVPLLIRAPFASASECSVPVIGTDIFPTLLNLASLPLRPDLHIDGESLAPLLSGSDVSKIANRPLYWHYPHYGNQGGTPSAAMRLNEWKLIRFYDGKPPELYQLDTDPGELQNRAAQHPHVTDNMLQMLEAWQQQNNACIPLPNPNPIHEMSNL